MTGIIDSNSKLETTASSDPYSLFLFAMNSPETRVKYNARLRRFFDYINLETEAISPTGVVEVNSQKKSTASMKEKCIFFTEKAKSDSTWAFFKIVEFLQFEKGRVERKEITAGTIRNYVKAIKLFCEMSEIDIPWKRITRGLPRAKRFANDRAPTLEEIRTVILYPDRRIKAIVYTMVSSGARLGMWDYLRWGHITPITRNGEVVAAKLKVYAGEEEEYFSFISPEAFREIDKWIIYRKDSGEDITKESWVMRNLWNVTLAPLSKSPQKNQDIPTTDISGRGLVSIPKKLKSQGVKRLIMRALYAQGLRKRLEDGKKRHEFQSLHGFRKWFKTRCELAGLKSINVETLMSHSLGISDSYYRATESELLEDYLKAAPFLTISQENQLILENHEIKRRNVALERENDEVTLFRKELEPLIALKNTLLKEGILKEIGLTS